jgi:hypothetical protein
MDGPVLSFFPLILDLLDVLATACGLYVAWAVTMGRTRLATPPALRRTREIQLFLARARRARGAAPRQLAYKPSSSPAARKACPPGPRSPPAPTLPEPTPTGS